MKSNTKNRRNLTSALIMIALIVLAGTAFYQFKYKPDNPSLAALQSEYENDPALLSSQDRLTSTDKNTLKEMNKRPLLRQLPYTDGYIYVSTSRTSYHLLVQYTTTLEDANKQFAALLTKNADTGRHYEVNFRKVRTLVQYD